MPDEQTPVDLFAGALRAEPARPFYIFFDDALGARVELSPTTLSNWVSKTGNLLQDELGVSPGDRIAVSLPTHWFGAVWMLAAWSAGLVVDLDSFDGADVGVVGPDSLSRGSDSGVPELVVCGTHPLGGPFKGSSPLPDGAIDFGVEVLSFGDFFRPYGKQQADDPALITGGRTFTAAELVSSAASFDLSPGARVMTSASPAGPQGYLPALLAPLAVRGSVVLVANADSNILPSRTAEEKVTADLMSE